TAGPVLGVVLLAVRYGLIALVSRPGLALSPLARPPCAHAVLGKAPLVSAAYTRYPHGTTGAHKTMGLIAPTTSPAQTTGPLDTVPAWLDFLHPDGGETDIDGWIIATCALVMAAGTAAGGWRMIKTLGHKMVKLHPIDGFAAESASATILVTAAHFGMPVPTTHNISTEIMGVGFAKTPRALKMTV